MKYLVALLVAAALFVAAVYGLVYLYFELLAL